MYKPHDLAISRPISASLSPPFLPPSLLSSLSASSNSLIPYAASADLRTCVVFFDVWSTQAQSCRFLQNLAGFRRILQKLAGSRTILINLEFFLGGENFDYCGLLVYWFYWFIGLLVYLDYIQELLERVRFLSCHSLSFDLLCL